MASQTGKNFEGDLNWAQAGKSAVVGGVAGAASAGAGVWAANANFLVNGVNSPILRSAIVSPIAGSAGHIAGGTTANLLEGQNFTDAFGNSFEGLGKSALLSAGIGMGSTVVSSYANGISPWNGRLMLKPNKNINFAPSPDGDNITLYRGMSGNENKNGALFMTDDPNYAKIYGENVRSVTINRSAFYRSINSGGVSTYRGNYVNNSYTGLEFKIMDPALQTYIKNQILK